MLLHRREAARDRPRYRRPTVGLLGLALLLSACGTTGPTASPAPSTTPAASVQPTPVADPATVYATIEDQVVEIRDLQPKTKVEPKILDDAGIKKLVADSFSKDNPADVVAANERLLKAFDLLPADASLSKLYIDLLGSQVAGLYNPDDKSLYVVSRSGGLGPAEKTTFAHEFTHALQDQNFDLGSLKLDEIGTGDRSLGRLGLVEGDAVLSQSNWQIDHLTQSEVFALLAAAANDPSSAQLMEMPPILRDSLLFPYTAGLSFVTALQSRGGWAAVNAAYTKPPDSTEQVLHPEKYAAAEAPVVVTLPKDLATSLGNGWKVALEDTFGEFQLGVWLKGNTEISSAAAADAAAGWGGDRVALVAGPGGAWGVVLRTAWDSDADAAAFEAAAAPLTEKLTSPAALLPGAGGLERWIVIGSSDAVLTQLAGTLGLAG